MAIEDDMAAEFGGPGPEDIANGAAALAAGLVREARVLAQAAAALGSMTDIARNGGDVRRIRFQSSAAADAALLAAFSLGAAAMLDRPDAAERIVFAAKRVGAPPSGLIPLLRAAALGFHTDDAAARIAASTLAAAICARLHQDH